MIYFTTLFILFLYFKMARVHKKEEQMTPFMLLQHIIVFGIAVVLYMYGFSSYEWYYIIGSSLFFFITAALMITAIQLGIFIDGKPLFGISMAYKLFPLLTIILSLVTLKLVFL